MQSIDVLKPAGALTTTALPTLTVLPTSALPSLRPRIAWHGRMGSLVGRSHKSQCEATQMKSEGTRVKHLFGI